MTEAEKMAAARLVAWLPLPDGAVGWTVYGLSPEPITVILVGGSHSESDEEVDRG